jgi:ribosome-associated toxin RatA of RatAB toxin-antitoxin module
MDASILMQMGRLNHSFTTRNTLIKDSLIHIQLLNGPFKRLTGDWKFTPLQDEGCKIELTLDFEYSNRIIAMLIGPMFNKIANSLVDAFCQRAHHVYLNQ